MVCVCNRIVIMPGLRHVLTITVVHEFFSNYTRESAAHCIAGNSWQVVRLLIREKVYLGQTLACDQGFRRVGRDMSGDDLRKSLS
ncbi:MAG: hypothetical protein CMM07_15950 [Rhodopirellula sp.]|nr:hypothetical protein [Rhodopirellula sp.]